MISQNEYNNIRPTQHFYPLCNSIRVKPHNVSTKSYRPNVFIKHAVLLPIIVHCMNNGGREVRCESRAAGWGRCVERMW